MPGPAAAPIRRVDVSLDGGRNWQTARLDAPVLDKSLTRFYLDFDWNGEEFLVQSRAMDSTGYVQPTKDELAQDPRRQLGLSQHRHPDLAGARQRRGRQCRAGLGGSQQASLPPCLCTAPAEPETRERLGRQALPEEIAAWDTDVRPDGGGLPRGRGTVKQGEEIYLARCASCHGEFGQGAGRWPALAGGRGR